MSNTALRPKFNNQISNFDKDDWASAYCNVEKELTNFKLKPKEGKIPKNLNGTFFRNGPGRLERNGHWVHHPFDGDGMIASIVFNQSEVFISNRFIRTQAWQEEEKAGQFTYRGVFGTQKPGGILKNAFDLRLKNIANTNVIKLGDDLLALWEAAEPHALNPKTLETYGISTLNGVLKRGEAFSAHPRFDPGHNKSPKMVAFGVKTGPSSTLRLMEFQTHGKKAGQLISDRKDNFNGFAFLHDFAITPNWAIFLQNSISFNPLPFVLGQKGAAQCLSSNKESKGKLWLIPRDSGAFSGEQPRIIDGPDGFVFHHLNAYEEDNKIILESIYYNDFPSIGPNQDFREIDFKQIPEGVLKRCKINLRNNKISLEDISNQCCEFAMVNPKHQGVNARYAWMAIANCQSGNGPLQGIKKLDLKNNKPTIWSAGNRGFVSEPLFVAQENTNKEDSGWILSLIWNAAEKVTELIILNAENLSLTAKIELPIAIPHGLHGSWVNK